MGSLAERFVTAVRPLRFRGKKRLLAGLVPPRGEVVASIFGYRMSLDVSEAIQREIYMGTFEPEESDLIRRFLGPGMTFVDVGANVGYFTLLAARAVGPGGRVFAIEPGPYAHRRLEALVRENGLDHVSVYPMGLGDRAGTLDLYEPGETTDNYSPTMVPNPGWRPIAVPVRRLDDCLEEWGVRGVDVMKLDVEGLEPRVIEGGRSALARGAIRGLLCEFNDYYLRQMGSSPADLYATLQALGFEDARGPADFPGGCVISRFLVHRG